MAVSFKKAHAAIYMGWLDGVSQFLTNQGRIHTW
jgi:hypothetical protein